MKAIRWTDEEVEQHLRKFKVGNSVAVSVADAQSDIPNALDAAPQAVQVDQRFRVRVTSRGRRLADTDNNSVKALFDGITAAGIWRDDSSRFIEEICFTQKAGKEDQTIIEIWKLK